MKTRSNVIYSVKSVDDDFKESKQKLYFVCKFSNPTESSDKTSQDQRDIWLMGGEPYGQTKHFLMAY